MTYYILYYPINIVGRYSALPDYLDLLGNWAVQNSMNLTWPVVNIRTIPSKGNHNNLTILPYLNSSIFENVSTLSSSAINHLQFGTSSQHNRMVCCHARCCGVDVVEYERLGLNVNRVWLCPACISAELPY